MSQKQYISHYENLKDKWVDRHQDLQKILHEKHSEAREWIEKSTQHLLVGAVNNDRHVFGSGATLPRPG
jgi:hypothetical protein